MFRLEDNLSLDFSTSPSSSRFRQHPDYVDAVSNMQRNYQKALYIGKQPLMAMEDLLSNGDVDFNSFRKAVKSFSRSQSFSEIDNEYSYKKNQVGFLSQPITGKDSEMVKNPAKQRERLIEKIEEIIFEVYKDIMEGKSPKFILRNQKLWSNCLFEEKIVLKDAKDAQNMIVNFSAVNSRKKFCLILHLLSVIHRMMLKGNTCTRRELYYQNISWIGSQSLVDRSIRDVCCLVGAPQWELGVLATSKGLVAGPLTLSWGPNETKQHCSNTGGVLVPQDIVGITSVESAAKFILVVEKDAIFQKLLDEGALARLGPCIMLTGKGYPDINTRLLLKLLVDTLKIPSLALTDADPYGIEIMCTYRFGSLAMSHLADRLAVPSLRWLGIHPSDVRLLGSPSLPLMPADVALATNLLARPYCAPQSNNPSQSFNPTSIDGNNNSSLQFSQSSDALDIFSQLSAAPVGLSQTKKDAGGQIRRQVEELLEGGVKAEIESIDSLSQAYLTDRYIPHKIIAKDFI